MIQERDSNNVPLVTYTRGVGGLLARTDANGSTFYHADGNANITMLIDRNQAVVAKYLYDPFGNILSMSGPMANANTCRFASKEWNANTGFYYFGRRYYDPNLQRFVNRDPLAENGGLNLYGYCGNNPVSLVDLLGLSPTLQQVLVAAENAKGAYGGSGAPGWTATDSWEKPSGLGATLYHSADSGQYMLAFRGTQGVNPFSMADLKDWVANGLQLGGLSRQYDDAVSIAQNVHNLFGDNVTITGHSLGGGLASLAGLVTGLQTFTFNAAGLSPNTMKEYDVDETMDGSIYAYFVVGDPLSTIQNSTGTWPAVGNQISLYPNLPWYDYLYAPFTEDKLHSIDTVINSLMRALFDNCD